MVQVKIKENSLLARIAAKKLRCSSVAMVFGKTIHLHNSSRQDFLNNPCWVRHEIAHVKQYAELGLLKFIVLYLLETFNKGYENNHFEVEARNQEHDVTILSEVQFV